MTTAMTTTTSATTTSGGESKSWSSSLLRPVISFMYGANINPSGGFFGSWLYPTLMKPIIQVGWRLFYQGGSRMGPDDEKWQYMNLGYVPEDGKLLELDAADAIEISGNTCIQLYHETVRDVVIEGKNVVEVGCGRGGGASYIARYLKPATMTAIDLSINNIEFARKTNEQKAPNLKYQQGDALNLPFEDSTLDVVVNVESSHCYPDFAKFVSEVYRVLKPGGYFAFCDFRYVEIISQMEQDFQNAGFIIQHNIDITKGVLTSMELCTPGKEKLMREIAGPWLYNAAEEIYINFGGLKGSQTYQFYETGVYQFRRYILQKPE